MKKSKDSKPRITSLEQLRLHRQRLELEVEKTELAIMSEYRYITSALAPLNVVKAVGYHMSSLKIFTSAFALGKALLARKKKKKKKKENNPETDEAGS